MTTAEWRESIPALADMIYLNCGWAGPQSAPVTEAVQGVLALEAARGPATADTVPILADHITAAREALARLLGTAAERVALTGNATSGLAIVAAGLDWRAGDEVIISDQEHPSNALPWYQLGRRFGVVVREVPVREDVPSMLEEYARAITGRTRLISVSHVQWSTGQVMPLRELGEMIHAGGGWLVVDAAQSAGQIPVRVEALGADCYSVPGQKWLLGPSGTGGAYFSPALTEELAPSHVGWASVRDYHARGRFEWWEGARRFETATVSAALHAGLARAIEVVGQMGVEQIRSRIQALVTALREMLDGAEGVRPLSPSEEGIRSGILTVRVRGGDPGELVRRLFEEHRIAARSVGPLEAVRFSIHGYNTEEEMEKVAGALCRA